MKVLWFVNKLPAVVAQKLGLPNASSGGWLDALEQALRVKPGIDLSVASVSPKPYRPFEDLGVMYYNLGVGQPDSALLRIVGRWREEFRPEENLSDSIALIRHVRPDVVHVHGTESAFGLVCRYVPVPSVISLQGLMSVIDRMDYRGIDASLLSSLSPGLFLRGGGIAHTRIRTRRAAERERRIIAGCKNFIGRTRFDEDVVRALNPSCTYFAGDYRILRPDFYSEAWTVDSQRDPIVFCTCGTYWRKGVGTLLDAASVLQRNAFPGIRVRIAGDLGSPEEGERAAKRRIRKLGLEDTVVLLGAINSRSVADELRRAKVFVLASHVDNSPNSLAEAMMIGLPCVATSVGGVPSMARDEVEALLVQDGDPYALAGALQRVLSDETLASELGRRARETAQARHNPQRIVDGLLNAYREVVR